MQRVVVDVVVAVVVYVMCVSVECLTTLQYDQMVQQLLKIFGDTVSQTFGTLDVKEGYMFVASNGEER